MKMKWMCCWLLVTVAATQASGAALETQAGEFIVRAHTGADESAMVGLTATA